MTTETPIVFLPGFLCDERLFVGFSMGGYIQHVAHVLRDKLGQ